MPMEGRSAGILSRHTARNDAVGYCSEMQPRYCQLEGRSSDQQSASTNGAQSRMSGLKRLNEATAELSSPDDPKQAQLLTDSEKGGNA